MVESNGALRETILQRHQLRRESCDVPEWGDVKGFVRTVRGDELAKSRAIFADGAKPSDEEFMVHTVALCYCDDEGNAVFSDADKSALLAGPLSALQRVFRAAMDLNGWSASAVEAIEKN